MHTRQYSKHLTHFNKFNPHNNPIRWDYYVQFAAYEETVTQRGEITCLRSHGKSQVMLESKPKHSESRICVFIHCTIQFLCSVLNLFACFWYFILI